MSSKPIGLVAIALALTLLISAPLRAAGGERGLQGTPVSQAPQTTQAPPKPEPTPKVPAPPIFPRHRRGLYLNGMGLEVLDAMPQAPPLETDDPGVPEKGEYEINLGVRGDFSRHARSVDLFSVDANYGLLPRILGRELPTQLTFEMPLAGAKAAGVPFTAGVGPAELGLKFNFYNSEHHSIEVAFYPQIEFALGSRPVDKGLAEPGQTLSFPLLLSKELKYATVVINGALNKPLNDPGRRITGTFGIGMGLALTRHFVAMAEFHSESRFDFAHDRLLTVNVGVMHAISHSLVFYTNLGHSLLSDDGSGHAYLGFGVKVLIKPSARKK